MKELTFDTMFAVFEEVFGAGLFWSLIVVAVLVTVAFIYMIAKERSLKGKRILRAEIVAPVGGLLAILFVQYITSSGFGDLGGPIDVIVLALIGIAGAIGFAILVYVLQGLFEKPSKEA